MEVRAFKDSGAVNSEEFGKCIVNFTRGDNKKNRTIVSVSKEYILNTLKKKRR